MKSRHQVGDKPQKHPHYLKGTILCGRCGSRMMFSRNRGRWGGLYDYFVCRGRHSGSTPCDLPYVSVQHVESAIEDYYDTIVLGPDSVKDIHTKLMAAAKRRNVSVK